MRAPCRNIRLQRRVGDDHLEEVRLRGRRASAAEEESRDATVAAFHRRLVDEHSDQWLSAARGRGRWEGNLKAFMVRAPRDANREALSPVDGKGRHCVRHARRVDAAAAREGAGGDWGDDAGGSPHCAGAGGQEPEGGGEARGDQPFEGRIGI